MYSMKRTMRPLSRKWRAIGSTASSLTPRLTTMLILIGPRPAAAAASIPASTRSTGKPTSLIAANTSLSRPSRLTVIRRSPASLSARALRASAEPLVVMARSPSPGIRASIATSRSSSRRTSGSPPVRRILLTPWSPTKIRASRSISSNVRSSARSRNS